MKEHELKTWPIAFDAIANGSKRFEYRKNDRDFQVGDTLLLRCWDPNQYVVGKFDEGGSYTDRPAIRARVTYIAPGGLFGIPAGYCVMSIEPAGEPRSVIDTTNAAGSTDP